MVGLIGTSCYEAGRDGFWLHRYLASAGVETVVVDASSIEVPRRLRRAKTDRLDLESLLRLLIRHHAGECSVWRIVNVPSRAIRGRPPAASRRGGVEARPDAGDQSDQGPVVGPGGVRHIVGTGFEAALDELRLWDGSSLSIQFKARLVREWTRGRDLTERIRENEKLRASLLAESEDPAMEQVRQLMRLRGVGINGAWLLVMEFFAWRDPAGSTRIEGGREPGSSDPSTRPPAFILVFPQRTAEGGRERCGLKRGT